MINRNLVRKQQFGRADKIYIRHIRWFSPLFMFYTQTFLEHFYTGTYDNPES